MATSLNKTVTRKCTKPFGNGKRHLIVSLEAGDMISMRESGLRQVYTTTLEKLYYQLVRWDIEEGRREKSKEKQLIKLGLA